MQCCHGSTINSYLKRQVAISLWLPPLPSLANLRELKALREQAALSLEDVAREAGISPHYLQMIESGEREASDVLKRTLARALKVSGWQDE